MKSEKEIRRVIEKIRRRKEEMMKKNKYNKSLDEYLNRDIKKKNAKSRSSFLPKEGGKRGRPRLIENSIRLCVYIPKELDEEFRELVNQKYSEYKHGALSLEVCEALAYWVYLHKQGMSAQMTQKINPVGKVTKVAIQLRKWFVEKMGFIPRETTLTELRKAV